MSAPTVVPADLVEQLAELSPGCEAITEITDCVGRVHPTDIQCPEPARWVITVTGPCGHPQKAAICDGHHDFSHRVRPGRRLPDLRLTGVPAQELRAAVTAVIESTSPAHGRTGWRWRTSQAPMSSRTCAWCRGPIPAGARRDSVCCSKRCRQARHRAGRRVQGPCRRCRGTGVEPIGATPKGAAGVDPDQTDIFAAIVEATS